MPKPLVFTAFYSDPEFPAKFNFAFFFFFFFFFFLGGGGVHFGTFFFRLAARCLAPRLTRGLQK